MISYDWIGFILVLVACLLITAGPVSSRFRPGFKNLLLGAFFVHVMGSVIRYAVLYGFYRGGDAGRYYRWGIQYAESFRQLEFVFDVRYGWGTEIVGYITGIVLSLIGPTKHGAFLFFGYLAFLGLLLFVKAFAGNYSWPATWKYARWILLWPSLWFWPSSIGKDALILLATGMLVFGYARVPGKINWFFLLGGIAIGSIIRPHVGAVMVVSLLIAHWFSIGRRWGVRDVVQGLLIIGLAFYVVSHSSSSMGLDDTGVEGIQSYGEEISRRSTQGGSSIEAPGIRISGIPMAFVNMLLRPFPWEVGHIMSAATALEVMVFWWIFWIRRKRVLQILRSFRSNRLLLLGLPLGILYILMLGMVIGNLGIIARQRTPIWPLLFVLIEAVPEEAAVRQATAVPRKGLRLAPHPFLRARRKREIVRDGVDSDKL